MHNRRNFLKGIAVTLTGLFWAARLKAAGHNMGVVKQKGQLLVNGQPVSRGFEVKPGSKVKTGPGAESIIVIDHDAFLFRENTEVEFPEENTPGQSTTEKVFKVISGGILSVFGPQKLLVDTPTATIGIRGTAMYVRIDPDRVYACLCYGEALMQSKNIASANELLKTKHHDSPRYIYPKGEGRTIRDAPVVDHTDEELIMLEALVGRIPPFGNKAIGGYKKLDIGL